MASKSDKSEEKTSPKNKKGSFLNANTNMIVSISAIGISLMTLFVLMYQSHLLSKQFELAQKHQYASVLPYLEIGPSVRSDAFHINLGNTGVGPAFIKDVYIVVDSTWYQLDIYGFVDQFAEASDSLGRFSYSSLYPGRVIQAGKNLNLLSVTGERESRNFLTFLDKHQPILVVEFASVFDQRWIIDSRFLSTPIPKEEYVPIYVRRFKNTMPQKTI